MSKDIICFGDCNIDLITRIDEIPERGGCSFSDSVVFNVGGSMLNTSAALKALGLNVGIVTKIGDDFFGTIVMDFLTTHGFDQNHVMVTNHNPTGAVITMLEPDGEKRWISARLRAADRHITTEELTGIGSPSRLFITGVSITEGVETRLSAIALARRIKEQGGTVYLDPNIRVAQGRLPDEIRGWFFRILPYVNVLLTNEKELELLGGHSDYLKSCEVLLGMGIEMIWEKRGSKGARLICRDGVTDFEPADVSAVDVSGAGDAFNGAIIYAEQEGFTRHAAGWFANQFAGYTVTKIGTTSAFPSKEELVAMVKMARKINSL